MILAGVAWVTAFIVVGLRDATPVMLALWSAAAITLAAARCWRRRRSLSAVLAVAAMGLSVAAVVASVVGVTQPHRQPGGLIEAAQGGRVVTTEIEVTSLTPERFRGTVRAWGPPEERSGAAAPVLVMAVPPKGVAIGAVLEVTGSMRATEPGESAAFLIHPSRIELRAEPPPLLATMAELREGFRSLATGMPGLGAGLLPGLAIGDTGEVTAELDTAMKTTSLSHLTAVSGANCAIVTALAFGIGGVLRLPRLARAVFALVALAGFVLLVTPEPSVIRAAVMACVVLVALARGRPARGVPVLALTVLLLVLRDPWLSREYGFVLSVLATAGLLLLAAPIGDRLARWMPRPVALTLALPIAAQLACQPVIVLLQPSLPTYGVVANVLAAPAAPVATVLGSLACALLPFVPSLAAALAWLAWLPATWIATLATTTAQLPWALLPWPEELLGFLALTVLTVLGLVAVLNPRRRRTASFVAALLLAVLVGGTVGVDALRRLEQPGDWRFAMCDVGQGDAVLVRSAESVALIDTGPDPERLTGCLDRLGIDRIDLLVLTHFDHDHAGASAAVAGRVVTVLTGPTDGARDEAILAVLSAGGASVVAAESGMRGSLGEYRWRVLWPQAGTRQAGNGASVALAFEAFGACAGGCPSALLLGDLAAREQARLVASGSIGPVDLVKVSHHGSADQHAELYRRSAAMVGLIGVGADNGYGHPTDEALAMLEASATTVARTDRHGLVLVAADPRGGLRLWTERSGP